MIPQDVEFPRTRVQRHFIHFIPPSSEGFSDPFSMHMHKRGINPII